MKQHSNITENNQQNSSYNNSNLAQINENSSQNHEFTNIFHQEQDDQCIMRQQIQSNEQILTSNDYNEGNKSSESNTEVLKPTVTDREQIINHFKIVITIEKGFLLHVLLSFILCVFINVGFFANPHQNMLDKSPQLENSINLDFNNYKQNYFTKIIPKDNFSCIDYYLITFLQNLIYIIILSRVIREDNKFLYVMQSVLTRQREKIKQQPSSESNQQNAQSLQEQERNEEYAQIDWNQGNTISIFDSLIQDNLIVQRRNRSANNWQQIIDKKKKSSNNKKGEQKNEEEKFKYEDLNMINLKRELHQFEQGIIHHRQVSKKDNITLYNVLENITETQNFGSKLFVASSTVVLFMYNIYQIGSNTLDPQYEIGILVFLGIPAIMMLLPFCVVLLTLATSVIFLLVYGLSILILLTYSVSSKQILYLFKILQLRSKFLKNMPELIGQTCSICLFDYENQYEKISILRCNHVFHYDCIKHWMVEKDVCPVCRKKN